MLWKQLAVPAGQFFQEKNSPHARFSQDGYPVHLFLKPNRRALQRVYLPLKVQH